MHDNVPLQRNDNTHFVHDKVVVLNLFHESPFIGEAISRSIIGEAIIQ